MLLEISRKELVLKNALTRLRRASLFAASALRGRRQKILAANSAEGRQYFLAMKQALARSSVESVNSAGPANSLKRNVEEDFISDALRFISEPVQKTAIGYVLMRGAVQTYSLAGPGKMLTSSQCLGVDNIVAELAWGAFSFNKRLQSHSIARPRFSPQNSINEGCGKQLNLQDLNILDCAVCYHDRELDYSFMMQLSADGAEIVHRVAMLIACDYNLRVDRAIVAAAKILLDPLVGGDADHCCCMLKRRELPRSWAEYYDLH